MLDTGPVRTAKNSTGNLTPKQPTIPKSQQLKAKARKHIRTKIQLFLNKCSTNFNVHKSLW